jgi:hypothetical protein
MYVVLSVIAFGSVSLLVFIVDATTLFFSKAKEISYERKWDD